MKVGKMMEGFAWVHAHGEMNLGRCQWWLKGLWGSYARAGMDYGLVECVEWVRWWTWRMAANEYRHVWVKKCGEAIGAWEALLGMEMGMKVNEKWDRNRHVHGKWVTGLMGRRRFKDMGMEEHEGWVLKDMGDFGVWWAYVGRSSSKECKQARRRHRLLMNISSDGQLMVISVTAALQVTSRLKSSGRQVKTQSFRLWDNRLRALIRGQSPKINQISLLLTLSSTTDEILPDFSSMLAGRSNTCNISITV